MFPPPTVSTVPTRKSLSRTDLLALALILMILMVIDLPIYRSILENQRKRVSNPAATAHKVPMETASTKTRFTNRLKPGVPSLTKSSGASNSKTAR